VSNLSQVLPRQAIPSRCGRCFDLVCAGAGLLVLWPVLLLVALAVLVFDGWPVFFKQERIGRHGRPFPIWKFRTMSPGSAGAGDPLVTAACDPRITRIGRRLRRLKLDELPQLINVLAGHMSIIGPRPEVRRYVDLGDPAWQAVLAVRPGITDLATLAYLDEEQILSGASDPESSYRETILPRKLALNVKYQGLRTRRKDLELIFLTLVSILHPERRNRSGIERFLAAQ
jgi:lipopolysaccharide/colanic/teichoic acid biosynthesis glycosyltransferase